MVPYSWRRGGPLALAGDTTRTYSCGVCGLVLDRDLNAAINLARWQPKESSTVTLLDPTRVPLLSTA